MQIRLIYRHSKIIFFNLKRGVLMKNKAFIICIICFTLLLAFTSCTTQQETTQNNAQEPATASDDGIMDDMTTQEPVAPMPQDSLPQNTQDGANAMELVPQNVGNFIPKSRPHFLNEDLQNLYIAANYMYWHYDLMAGFNTEGSVPVDIGLEYDVYLDNGFATYNDFSAALNSVFTTELIATELDVMNQYFEGEDGKLYTAMGARGSNPFYVESEFLLVSADENTIVMELTITNNENAMEEDLEPEYSYYTEEIVLTNTENGWRFSKFALPY